MHKFITILAFVLLLITPVFAEKKPLTAVDVTEGKWTGYKALHGYEKENLFQVYFKDYSKGTIRSYQVAYENLKKVDMNEVIQWNDEGKSYQATRSKLYEFFSKASHFREFDATDDRKFSQSWFLKTFGEVFEDWSDDLGYSGEAERLVERYFGTNDLLPDSSIPDDVKIIY